MRSVSSNVALPVLPEARMEMRNEMRKVSAGDDCRVATRRQKKKEATETQRHRHGEIRETTARDGRA